MTYDNAMIEAIRSRMQVELFDSRRPKTGVEFANPIFEYIEIFHGRRRCASLGMLRPIELLRGFNKTRSFQPCSATVCTTRSRLPQLCAEIFRCLLMRMSAHLVCRAAGRAALCSVRPYLETTAEGALVARPSVA
jgi:hypothetical protein